MHAVAEQANGTAFICNECIDLCSEIMSGWARNTKASGSGASWSARSSFHVFADRSTMRVFPPDRVASSRSAGSDTCSSTGGGLLSVALSLGSPPAGVTRRHVVVEPGLSSSFRPRPSLFASRHARLEHGIRRRRRTTLAPRTAF
jgi:hypothetical protein